MQDNSIDNSDTSDNASNSGGVKVYASLKSLAVDDGSGNSTPPAVGDEVDLDVKGKVESIDGDVACVSPTEVNGEPAPQPPKQASAADQEAELRKNFGNSSTDGAY